MATAKKIHDVTKGGDNGFEVVDDPKKDKQYLIDACKKAVEEGIRSPRQMAEISGLTEKEITD